MIEICIPEQMVLILNGVINKIWHRQHLHQAKLQSVFLLVPESPKMFEFETCVPGFEKSINLILGPDSI